MRKNNQHSLKLTTRNLIHFIQIFISSFLIGPKKIKYATETSNSAILFSVSNDKNADEYLTVAQLSQRYPAFTQGSIRWLIFNEETNGFGKAVRRIGRKVVIKLSAWKQFLEEDTQL